MRINLEGIGRTAWVKWRDGVEFLIEPAPLTKIQRIRSRATTHIVTGRGTDRAVTEDMDIGKFIQGVADLIKDWRGISDQNGKELKCTSEMKVQLLDCFTGNVGGEGEVEEESLARFITEQAQQLARDSMKQKEEETNNFLST